MQINSTQITVVRGSVLEQSTDAIVNAANTAMQGGGGVDGAIHRAAGRGLIDELRRAAPHGAQTGAVVVTGAHSLPQRFVFHVPGPVWRGGSNGEAAALADCYRNCLAAADKRALDSIAFCSVSTGVYGYPISGAAPLAVGTVVDYFNVHPETSLTRVVFAMYGQDEYQAFMRALVAATDAFASR